jgi:uncharacterized ion transporter superfamily protein YfcC
VKFPHPLALLAGCIALAAALTWVLPAGTYERHRDDATGRDVVVAGTYHRVPATPVTPFQAVVAIPKGMAEAAQVIFFVLLVGGAFVVVDRTGALARATTALASSLEGRAALVIPIVSLCFAAGGALENMQEEIIPLIPVLLILMARLGYDPMVAVASSVGAAGVGSAFSPINPFQVGIAQKLAQLPLLSGWQFRVVVLVLALTIWILATMRYAGRTRTAGGGMQTDSVVRQDEKLSGRDAAILGLVLLTFAVFVYGIMKLGWDFDHLAALFFVMGCVAGLVGGLRVNGTAAAFADGFAAMAYAGALIGFARAIFVVLNQGQIIDTIVNGIFTPLGHLPVAVSALGMMLAHAGLHFPVPSVSGQAVLTMPVLVPLSDLIGLQRQVTVLSYQYGAGLSELLTPTNGALMAVLAAAGVPYSKWLRFAGLMTLALLALGAVAILIAIGIRLA